MPGGEGDMKDAIKTVLHGLGLYAPARALYRAVSSRHREERRLRREFFAQLVSPGDLCFDIGANVGQSIEALRACDASVVALEPNPHCMPALRHQFSRDPKVTLVEKAVGDRPGKATLHFSGTAATASLRDDWHRQDDQTVEVDIVTLDQLIAAHGAPKLLKVDVEGFELEVFLGLGRGVPVIYFEMHAREIQVVEKILAHLRKLGRIEGINVISEDHSAWLWPDWPSVDDFMGRMAQPPAVANVVVRMQPSS
jgi:FkbM family methyltransferase